jgi:selenide,water dikinase
MRTEPRPRRDLLLVGGGHAHALVLRRLAMQAPAALRMTLISPAPLTPYSGMLPGLLAGHYALEDTHIDLERLCRWAGVRFLVDEVVALDPQRRLVTCRERGEMAYDLLSLDIGSQPELDSVPGARQYATPVKPVSGLWARWQGIEGGDDPGHIAVVGGGAGSVEIAMAIAHRLRARSPMLTLYCGAARILQGYGAAARRRVERQLDALGIKLRCAARAVEVSEGRLHFGDGSSATFDTLIWSTGAAAAPWVAASGLPVDERGFMAVRDTLQSTTFDDVFGAGDIATQVNHPRPKAGVYAVRQGPVLAHNLLAALRGEALREHVPQRHFLSLLALGSRAAVAERQGLSLSGAWVWRWKDRIDRGFMRRFQDLPDAPQRMGDTPVDDREQAICGGCGAKVEATGLQRVLTSLATRYPGAIDSTDLDDAVLLDVSTPLLQSTDQLRALVDDPWLMGRIAAQHALSDLYACGARPHSALAQVTLPFAAAELVARDLHAVLDGALSVLQAAGCRLLGGHSMQGPELQIGFTVNGLLDDGPAMGKRGARPGDTLLLTKTLGSGALLAAHMQCAADGRDVTAALGSMQEGNGEAAIVARRVGATALTDVTGFGLAGHLREMLGGTLSATIDVDALPAQDGALAAMERGIFSTLHADNRRAVAACLASRGELPLRAELAFDPQTSGGLLMAVPPQQAAAALSSLRESGVRAASIGELHEAERAGESRLRLCSRAALS